MSPCFEDTATVPWISGDSGKSLTPAERRKKVAKIIRDAKKAAAGKVVAAEPCPTYDTEAGAYTRPLFSSTSAVSYTKHTLMAS